MKTNIKFLFFIIAASVAFLSSCDNEDDGPAVTPIVGTWTYNTADLAITVNNQPLATFLVSTGEYTAAEAAAAEVFIKTAFIEGADMSGSSITFNSNGTFRAVDGSDVTNGTYSLQNNNTKLSMTSDGDTQIIDIKELTNNKMVLEFGEENSIDIDENGVNENLKLAFKFIFTK